MPVAELLPAHGVAAAGDGDRAHPRPAPRATRPGRRPRRERPLDRAATRLALSWAWTSLTPDRVVDPARPRGAGRCAERRAGLEEEAPSCQNGRALGRSRVAREPRAAQYAEHGDALDHVGEGVGREQGRVETDAGLLAARHQQRDAHAEGAEPRRSARGAAHLAEEGDQEKERRRQGVEDCHGEGVRARHHRHRVAGPYDAGERGDLLRHPGGGEEPRPDRPRGPRRHAEHY